MDSNYWNPIYKYYVTFTFNGMQFKKQIWVLIQLVMRKLIEILQKNSKDIKDKKHPSLRYNNKW